MKIYAMSEFQKICFSEVVKYHNKHNELSTNVAITEDQVYMVWGVKALQNFKGLFSTTIPDGMYYEITYNGNAEELYFDAYKKQENVVIK